VRRALLAAALALAPAGARAALASNGGQTLRRLTSARAAALGGAFAAVDGGLDSFGVNPAGLAAVRKPEAQTTLTSGVLDDVFGFLGYAHPLAAGAAAAAGLSYYDAGSVEVVELNGNSRSVAAQRDYVGSVGGALPLAGGLSVGALGKAYDFTLAQSATARGFAGDAGVLWRSPVPGLSAGASLQNMGPGVKFEDQSDPLPLTARAGAAWTRESGAADREAANVAATRVTLTADAVKVRDERVSGAAGGEFAADFSSDLSVAVRAAWAFGRDSDGLSIGVGVREGRFVADYALVAKRDLGSTHAVTLGCRF
jgi:hypothetical protein